MSPPAIHCQSHLLYWIPQFCLPCPVGGWLYLQALYQWHLFLLFILLTMCFFTSFLNLVTIAMQSMELGSGLDHVKQIMDMEVMQSGNKELPKTGSYGIDFAHVTFRYTKEGEEVLSDIDLHLKAGSINAFVGPSGAGKTTAAQLIGRYWDADSGTVKIGGVPVNELKAENLSDLTAFVFQDVFLMEDTLLENIRMGNPAASDEDVIEIARRCGCYDFIMNLENGFETQVGSGGGHLSVGSVSGLPSPVPCLRMRRFLSWMKRLLIQIRKMKHGFSPV